MPIASAMNLKSAVKKLAKHSVLVMRLYIWYRRRQSHARYPNWREVVSSDPAGWADALGRAKKGEKVLLATSMGGLPTGVIMDSLLAAALTLRGYDVHVLLCDSFLPACLMCENGLISPGGLARTGPQSYFCRNCFARGARLFGDLGITVHKYSGLVSAGEMAVAEKLSAGIPYEGIKEYKMDGLAIGEHAVAGALRFFARGALEGEKYAEQVSRLYLRAAVLTAYAVRRLTAEHKFLAASFINGIYVPQGIVGEVLRSAGVRVVNWNVAYRKKSFIFSHNDTYHHTLISEPMEKWAGIPFDDKLERELMDYLVSRQRGGRDWISFLSKNPAEDMGLIARELKGLDLSRPCIGMLTNVVWDAQLHYPANAFSNMIEWILETLRYYASRPGIQLVIRVHPAEISGDIPSRQPVMEEIRRAFPVLPENIFIIRPESRISTYKIMEKCKAVIIYGTKTGVELASRGVPVVVAGEAWIRNKGLTIDARTKEEYFRILDGLANVKPPADEQVKMARKYAYHFFFRRMIPVSLIEPTGGEPQFRIIAKGFGELLPGRSVGLDLICDGITKAGDFVYPSEKIGRGNE